MAKFCGGFKFDASLKTINGVLCLANAQTVDVQKAVTGCGQMWDGETFKIVKVDGYRPCVTLKNNGKNVNLIAGNCGVGLDGNFFVKVDKNSTAVDPIATGEDYIKYCLPMLDEKYSVTVEADGYTGKSQTIMNDKTQEVEVDLVKIQ